MGICNSCFGIPSAEYDTMEPNDTNQEDRRKQAAEAAERRLKESEGKGIKDPERLKKQQKKMEELEKKHEAAERHGDGDGLRWQVG